MRSPSDMECPALTSERKELGAQHSLGGPVKSPAGTGKDVSLLGTMAFASGAWGFNFFYNPMWSILPGLYSKYFGLSLASVAMVVLATRIFDGVLDTTIGFVSDWHRSTGGSRKTWVVVGSIGSVVACHFLFSPPADVSTQYYLSWSLAYFAAYSIAVIPHMAWGSELTLNYQARAKVSAISNVVNSVGVFAFYALPFLVASASREYTPEVLQDGIYVGGTLTCVGLLTMIFLAPPGLAAPSPRQESKTLLINSIVANKPLLLYMVASVSIGIAVGMWFGLVYLYLDSYLHLGYLVSAMFLTGVAVEMLAAPFWLRLIAITDKTTTWIVSLCLFSIQLICSWFLEPGDSGAIPFVLYLIASLFFCGHNIAGVSILGDIADYGKLKFRRDRSATYFGFNALIGKAAIGIGGGISLSIGSLFGVDPTKASQNAEGVVGLKIGFSILPMVFLLIGLAIILRFSLDRRRQGIIERRLRGRLDRADRIVQLS